eukprot:433816_1
MSFFAFSKTINSSFGRILKLVPSFKDSSDPQFTLYYLNKIIKELRFNSKAINILKDYELVGVLLPKLRDLITDNASKWNAQSTAQKHCIIAALECIVILKSSDKYNNMEWEAFMDDEFLQSLFDIIRIKETLNDELHSAHTQALIVHSIYYKQSTDQMIKNAIHETVLHNVVQWHTYNPSNLELVICALRVLRECYAKDAIKNAKEIQQKLMDIVIHLLNGLRTYLCDGWKTEVCKGLIVKVNKKPKPKKRDHRSGYGVSYSTNSKETNKSYYIKRVIHDSAYLDQNTAKKAPQQNDNNTITYSYMSMNRSTDEESKESDSEDDMKTIDGAWLELKEMQSDGFRRQQVKGYVNKKLHHKSIQLAGNQQTATLFTQLLDLLSFCMQLGGDQRLDLRSLGIMDTVQYLMKNAGKSGRQNDGDIPIVHRLIALDATIVLHDIVTDHNSALFKSFANAAIQQGLNDELFDQCVRKICGDQSWSSSYFSYSPLDDKKKELDTDILLVQINVLEYALTVLSDGDALSLIEECIAFGLEQMCDYDIRNGEYKSKSRRQDRFYGIYGRHSSKLGAETEEKKSNDLIQMFIDREGFQNVLAIFDQACELMQEKPEPKPEPKPYYYAHNESDDSISDGSDGSDGHRLPRRRYMRVVGVSTLCENRHKIKNRKKTFELVISYCLAAMTKLMKYSKNNGCREIENEITKCLVKNIKNNHVMPLVLQAMNKTYDDRGHDKSYEYFFFRSLFSMRSTVIIDTLLQQIYMRCQDEPQQNYDDHDDYFYTTNRRNQNQNLGELNLTNLLPQNSCKYNNLSMIRSYILAINVLLYSSNHIKQRFAVEECGKIVSEIVDSLRTVHEYDIESFMREHRWYMNRDEDKEYLHEWLVALECVDKFGRIYLEKEKRNELRMELLRINEKQLLFSCDANQKWQQILDVTRKMLKEWFGIDGKAVIDERYEYRTQRIAAYKENEDSMY